MADMVLFSSEISENGSLHFYLGIHFPEIKNSISYISWPLLQLFMSTWLTFSQRDPSGTCVPLLRSALKGGRICFILWVESNRNDCYSTCHRDLNWRSLLWRNEKKKQGLWHIGAPTQSWLTPHIFLEDWKEFTFCFSHCHFSVF